MANLLILLIFAWTIRINTITIAEQLRTMQLQTEVKDGNKKG